jgi:outer membrane lipoprotein carrier protein
LRTSIGMALMLSSLSGVAWASDAAPVIEAVEARYTNVETLAAQFVQTTKSPVYGDETQKGTVTLKRPSKMRWTFADGSKEFITDGSTMWIYNREDKQVIRYKDFGSSASAADSVLQSLDKIDELFQVELVSGDATQGATLLLKPKEPGQFKNIQLSLGEEMALQRVVITDPFDAVTDIQFEELKLGEKVEDTTFSFTVPDGVEVVDASAP